MIQHILGIDPANRTGFAHSNGYRGFVDLARVVDKHPGQRLMRFEEWLNDTLDKNKTELIAAEDASFGSPNPAVQAQHNELRGVIHLVAAEYGIEVKVFQPTTIKAFATGSGRADKKQMMRAYENYWGVKPQDDNECDARWIMELAGRPDCWPEPKAPKRTKRLPPPGRRLFS